MHDSGMMQWSISAAILRWHALNTLPMSFYLVFQLLRQVMSLWTANIEVESNVV